MLRKRNKFWHKEKRDIFQNSFQSVNINLKTLISYLFISRDFLTQFPLWCYALSSFFVHQSEHRLPFPAKHWIPHVDTDGTWCLSFFAFSLTGKNCLTPVWEEVVELCPCGKRSTQVINGLIFLKEKSLSRSDIGYYKTRQARQKNPPTWLPLSGRGKTRDSGRSNSCRVWKSSEAENSSPFVCSSRALNTRDIH